LQGAKSKSRGTEIVPSPKLTFPKTADMGPSRISGSFFSREPTIVGVDVVVPNGHPSTPHWPNTRSM
jgi:hypothetical protein